MIIKVVNMIYTHYSNSNSDVVWSLLLTNRLISFKFALLIAVVGSLNHWVELEDESFRMFFWTGSTDYLTFIKFVFFLLCSVMKSSIRFSENKTLVKAVVWIQNNYFNDTYCICCYFEVDLNILQHFLFLFHGRWTLTGFLKGSNQPSPELQPLQHHLFRYTKYRWWPTPRYISRYLWVGHHLPHVCVHLLSHLGLYLCWEVGRSLKVSMLPQWWIKKRQMRSTPRFIALKVREKNTHHSSNMIMGNWTWRGSGLIYCIISPCSHTLVSCISDTRTGTDRLCFWASVWGILRRTGKAILWLWFSQKR